MSDFKIGDTVYHEYDLGYRYPRTVVGVHGEFLWLDSSGDPLVTPNTHHCAAYRLKPKVYADGATFRSSLTGIKYEVKRSDVVNGKVYYTLYASKSTGLELTMFEQSAMNLLDEYQE